MPKDFLFRSDVHAQPGGAYANVSLLTMITAIYNHFRAVKTSESDARKKYVEERILCPKGIFYAPLKEKIGLTKRMKLRLIYLKAKTFTSRTKSKSGALKYRTRETLLENPSHEGAAFQGLP